MQVAILTPTYNRAHTLSRLYDSLLVQTDNNFVWYVIDDGSTDGTKKLIERYQKDQRIKIKYYHKKNGGKHRAINYGVERIKEELTFMVDSDDWLLPEAIEEIEKVYRKYKNNKTIAVYSFHKAYENGVISGPHYAQREFIGNHIRYRVNNHVRGENAEVVITEYFKKIKLPEIEGEKFLSEGYLWNTLAKSYETVYIDKPIYKFEYQTDGLTNNLKKMRFNNPKGVVECSKTLFDKKVSIIPKTKAMLRYIAYGRIGKNSIRQLLKDANCKMLFCLMLMLGIIYAVKQKTDNRREK